MFKRNDWIVGIFSILLGIFIIYRSTGWMNYESSDSAGPGYVPVALAGGMIIIGIIHLIGSWLENKKENDDEEISKINFAKEWVQIKPLLQITLVSIIYILTLKSVGYLIITPFLMASLLWIVKERRIKSIVVVSIGITILLFIIFYYGLKIKLPLGIMKPLFHR